jgi:hypothetical protein
VRRRDDAGDSDDLGVDRLLRAAAAKADSIDLALSAEDVSGRPRSGLSMPRYRSVAAGVLVAAVIVAIFVAPIPQLNFLHHRVSTHVTSTVRRVSVLSCPRTRLVSSIGWVPADADGVDGKTRLVPEASPSKVVICAYGGRKLSVLAGARDLRKGLPALASDLTWLPPPEATACGGVGLSPVQGSDPVPAAYLIGLSYHHGWLWVATGYSGGCEGASNGTFKTSADIGSQVKKAYETGRWKKPGSPSCGAVGFGRLGQQRSLVPGRPGSLSICYVKPGARSHETEVSVSHARLVHLRGLLNRESTFTSTNSCHESGSPVFFSLIFGYNTGPPVTVSVAHGCVPAINNGSLQATVGSAVFGLVQRYLKA